MTSEGGSSAGSNQASHLLSSNRKHIKSEKSSLSSSYEAPKSYGSTTKPVRSGVDIRMVGHVVDDRDTLQGLSIRYGVPVRPLPLPTSRKASIVIIHSFIPPQVEEIRRVNKLWTNDNIHFYKIIKIPVKTNSTFSDLDELELDVEEDKCTKMSSDNSSNMKDIQPGPKASGNIDSQTGNAVDSVTRFLEQIDGTIKENVQLSEKLRLESGKELMEKLERGQNAGRREHDLFGPLSFSSRNHQRPLVNRTRSDLMNTSDEQFFEL